MAKVAERIEMLERKVRVLEDLEKRLALAVIDVLPSSARNVSGYEIAPVLTGQGMRYVWKHFLRGSRSVQTFETREACVKAAQSDALKHLAFPTNDLSRILNKESRERHSQSPQAAFRTNTD